jgi:GNAT superfamily N-acetyltransferase
MTVSVSRPASAEDFDAARALMRAFVSWHRESHGEDSELIDAYFDPRAFEDELTSLPAYYSVPEGDLLLAYLNEAPAGCVALRRLDDTSCEMKRMFVYPDMQGHGIGRALGEAIVASARDSGYAVMRLDTSFRQTAALQLYRTLGFHEIDPYYDLPQPLRDWLVFMELELRPA